MKVCLMNDSFPPQIDGVANTVINYARNLENDPDHCIVGTPDVPGVVDDYPFPVVRYPSLNTTSFVGYRAGFPFSAKSINKLADFGPDVIHSHCPIMSTFMARVLRESINVPIVLTYHTKFDIDIANAIHSEALQQQAIKALVENVSACDEVWTVSRGAGDNLRSLGYQGDIRIMENGVDFPRGKADASAVSALREELGIAAQHPVYLFVGRLMWYKGIRLMLDALKKVADDGKAFTMVFAGDGMDRGEIEAYTKELGLSDRVRFLGAVTDREKLRAIFTMCDLFLFPSTFDTNGIVVREAAACGLASILIRHSCASEGITDGRNGYLIEETADSLAECLIRLYPDVEGCHTVGTNAMNEIYLSWEDSVAIARARYEIVTEEFRSRGGRKPASAMDEIFLRVSDIDEELRRFHHEKDELVREFTERGILFGQNAGDLGKEVLYDARNMASGIEQKLGELLDGETIRRQLRSDAKDAKDTIRALLDRFDRYL